MRIAVLVKSTTFHSGYGGLETQNKLLCEGLVRRGYDVLVFSPQQDLKFEAKYENGVKYHFLPCVYKLTHIGKNNWLNISSETFSRHHKEKPFDLVLSQSSAGLGVILNRHEFNVPVISISHGTIMGEFQTRLNSVKGLRSYFRLLKDALFVLRVFFGRQRKFVHGSIRVIAVSSAVREALINETFVSKSKVVVINNGIDPALFEQTSYHPTNGDFLAHSLHPLDKPKILYVGQITKSKGLDTVFRLSQEPEFSEISFEIIGGGDYLDELKSKVLSCDCANRVRIHGKMLYADLLPYLKSLKDTIFVFPTKRYEGFPMVLVEALFLGFPVVAYDVGGVSDAVKNEETGFLVPSGDYEEYKKKLQMLIRDSEKRKVFSENSRKFAYNELTLDKMLDQYEQVFKEVLKEYENITHSL
ncbi:glycosyltransferase family 4 protein [Patescibacteria group bacterium]|nr:glycosyltransferase family 4 protein [Patescibacteria group bacterium]HOM77591.1 glycosyltransferase family 4 protein [bacterium]